MLPTFVFATTGSVDAYSCRYPILDVDSSCGSGDRAHITHPIRTMSLHSIILARGAHDAVVTFHHTRVLFVHILSLATEGGAYCVNSHVT